MGVKHVALLLGMLGAAPAAAQESAQVKLVVQQGGREIGREEFTLRQGRGRGSPGTTLTATARYPATSATSQLAATLERTAESGVAKFQLEVDSPAGPTVILAAGSGARLIVRTVAKGSESGREMAGGPDVVLLDDQVFSLYAAVADLATPAGKSLNAIFPRTGRRASLTAQRESGDAGAIRVALTGDIAGTLVTDSDGRLRRLELPGENIVVRRAE
ncbi:MAG: hypothetical protein H0T90_00470 [Gemmatimonadales bacterium]|nr:hypothetical protein [Gemmatimonadales bacterium]